jgi:methionyl-tRNA formyltransferase
LQSSPVKEIALQNNLQVLQPKRARDETFIQDLGQLQPELIVVAAYGQILPKAILDLPRFGCLNVHTSLLPKYRGAAPIQWALLNGETETGVTLMKMDEQMDTGAILAIEKTPIRSDDNAQSLHDRLADLGAALLMKAIPDYVAGKIQPRPQPSDGVSYAPKIKKSDGRIDWAQPALTITNRVRAMIPWPGAFTRLPNSSASHVLKIWAAEVVARSGPAGEILQADKNGLVIGCGTDALSVSMLQAEGGRRMSAQEFLAGHLLSAGQKLG